MQRTHWCLADYVIRDKLYTGYASTVFKAQCKRSKEVVVLKVYTLPAVCDLYKYQIYREVNVHAQLRHANIVLLLAAFQEGDKVVMVQEYADGCDLFTLLHKYGGRLSERLAVQMVLEPFLRVLNYLHLRGIIHRDIKPENIMFTKNMVLKLGDFGLAIDMREERAVTRAGTLDYMAPEVLRCPYKSRPDENKDNRSLHYGARVDSWAAGVLAYELLVGFPPFFDQSRAATEDRIVNKSPEFSSIMSEEAKTFISRALHKSPTHRPTILEMLSHSWLEQFRVRRSLRDVLTMPTAPVGVPIAAAYPSPAMPALPPAPGTVLQAAPPCSQPPTAALATTNTRIRQEATLPSFSTATCPPAPVLQPTCDSYPATNLSPSGRVSAQAAAGPLPMTHHLSTISCGSPGALGAPMPARRFGQLEHDGPGFDCTPTPSTLVSQSMQPLGSLASSDSADISVIMNLSTSKALGSKEVAAMQTGSVLAMQR
ncbi:kinase-like domain-containing protein [Haematococcus lacustris]